MRERVSIVSVTGREILDSRGNPTVEAELLLEDGTVSRAAAPSGASTGSHEARELRDGDPARYGGKGVLAAAENISGEISAAAAGLDVFDQRGLDAALCALDGTEALSRLGANAVLAVSLAAARAAAASAGLPLYAYLGGAMASVLPVPMMNVVNGGAHAGNDLDIQEFMLVPVGADGFPQALRWCCEVFHALKKAFPQAGVGDEGGIAPALPSDADALRALTEAVKSAGLRPGKDVWFAVDGAVSAWFDGGEYRLPKRGKTMSRKELVSYWAALCGEFPLFSVEDGMAEDDWEGWRALTEAIGEDTLLVGDDLFVTNAERIRRGAEEGAAGAVLVKMNQAGTLTGTFDAMDAARSAGYGIVVSHRSGETEDTSIADLAVAAGCGLIKAGAPSRGERTAKYNRLLRIGEELGASAVFPDFGRGT